VFCPVVSIKIISQEKGVGILEMRRSVVGVPKQHYVQHVDRHFSFGYVVNQCHFSLIISLCLPASYSATSTKDVFIKVVIVIHTEFIKSNFMWFSHFPAISLKDMNELV
jgi:hypothetical protein